MTRRADEGNSVVILPIQHYDMKIHSFITENHYQTINASPTKTFQNQIRMTVNHSTTLIHKIPNGST